MRTSIRLRSPVPKEEGRILSPNVASLSLPLPPCLRALFLPLLLSLSSEAQTTIYSGGKGGEVGGAARNYVSLPFVLVYGPTQLSF